MESEPLKYPLVAIRKLVNSPRDAHRFTIGREPSLKAVQAASASENLLLFAVQHDQDEENPVPAHLYHSGWLVRLTEQTPAKVGINLSFEPVRRVKLTTIIPTEKGLEGVLEELPPDDEAKVTEVKTQLSALLSNWAEQGILDGGTAAFFLEFLKRNELAEATDGFIHFLNLSPPERQKLLDVAPLESRLTAILDLLREKTAAALQNPRNQTDPKERMYFAKWLAATGHPAEALAEYWWCFDHGLEHKPQFLGVRLSFLLGYLEDLGETYPPARESMRVRRDDLEQKLLQELASEDEIRDFTALNNHLKENAHLLEVFDLLKARQALTPKMSQIMLEHVLDLLYKAERYADILAGTQNVTESVAQKIKIANDVNPSTERMKEKNSQLSDEQVNHLFDYCRRRAFSTAGKYYEALLWENRLDEAAALAQQLLDFHQSSETYSVLLWHAGKAGNWEIANRFYLQAQTVLPEPGRLAVDEFWEVVKDALEENKTPGGV